MAPGAYPKRKHLKGPPIGFALALPSNFKTRLERISKGELSSLLGLIVSDEGKKFYNIDTWLNFLTFRQLTLPAPASLTSPAGRGAIAPWGPRGPGWAWVVVARSEDFMEVIH
jgi:hypothetical protein